MSHFDNMTVLFEQNQFEDKKMMKNIEKPELVQAARRTRGQISETSRRICCSVLYSPPGQRLQVTARKTAWTPDARPGCKSANLALILDLAALAVGEQFEDFWNHEGKRRK